MADEKPVNPVEDQELNDLLDSALEDFNKEQKVNEVDEKKESLAVTTNEENFETLEDAWTANIIEGAVDHFKENLQNLIKNDSELDASFKKMAQTIASVVSDEGALEDFNKEQKVGKVNEKKKSSAPGADEDSFETIEDGWSTNVIEEAVDQLEEDLQNLIKNDSELGASVKKMAQTLASVVSEDGKTSKDGASTDFESVIAQALNDLSATSETLQSDVDISELLGQASLEDGAGTILPIMQGMLQHLLSKEILYPSLKELVDKFPEWLEAKKTSISPDDLQRFNKQLELMRQVCSELEKEKDEDTKETKKKRFKTVISLMQEVQGCGQLPEELVGEHTMPFQVDAEGDPIIPALLRGMDSSQNCQLM
ncbi:peroxisomal biogenesis factor 19 isoform X2 [Lasioglossum baleicum]|uniref:peroxisomal biogenesis factor 19 isoform X2 n=1 Tax=Lasioglossum baleicum TaxID=434251 RepID=UPI003FCDF309